MLYKYIFEKSNTALAVINNQTGSITEYNQVFHALLGTTDFQLLDPINNTTLGISAIPQQGHYCIADDTDERIPVMVHKIPLDEEHTLLQISDIRDINEAFAAVGESAQRLTTLISSMQEGVLVEDQNRRIVFTNHQFLRMFGVPSRPDDMVGADCSTTAEDSKMLFTEPEGFVSRIADILVRRERVFGDKLELKDGRFFSRDYVPVFERDRYLGHMWIYRDVTDQENALKELRQQALTDPLTQIANRRLFTVRLRLELERLIRRPDSLSLVILDVDRFKEYNDDFGHQEGDEVLEKVSEILVRETRTFDLVARYGGEEFVIILPGAERSTGCTVAERCRSALESNPWPYRPITASFGLTSLVDLVKANTIVSLMEKLLTEADAALHYSKETGRNRVTCNAG